MEIFRHFFIQRLPARKDWLRLFGVVSVPIHMWAWLIFLHDLPGNLLRLNTWQILAMLAYVLVYTLFESIVATLVLTLLVWLVPTQISTDRYSLQGSVFLLAAVLLATSVHLQPVVVTSLDLGINIYRVTIGLVLFTSLSILIGLSWTLHRRPKIAEPMLAFMDRLSILAIVYLVLDGFAICLSA